MLVKINHNLFKILLLCASATVVSACTDHDWKGPDKNSERITFALQTANTDWQARSGRIEGCDIITLLDESTKDTLYLHPNITDMPAPDRAAAPRKGSRGEPIQNPDDFSRIQLNAQGVASFGITAYTSDGGQLYINNAEITRQNGKWEEAAPRFWPVEKLDFYGIAPYNALSADENNLKYNLTDKKVTFDYTVPHSAQGENRDAEAQHDIMMAFTGEQSKQTSSVTTKFWHILAGIQFEVADIAGGKINSITIRNVHGSGTATFDSSKIGGASAEDPTDSWQDNNTIPVTWVAADEPVVEYTQTFNVDVADQYPNQEAEGYDEQGVTSQNPKTTFLLMPQTLTDDAEIVINMTTLKDGEKTLTAKLGNGFTWKAGKIYKYTISTESINWTYVFEVKPVNKDASGDPRPDWIDANGNGVLDDGEYFYGSYSPPVYEYGVILDEDGTTYIGWHETSFDYEVISYRYRTNNPDVKEPVAWTANVGDATNEHPQRVATVKGADWMRITTADNGSVEPIRYNATNLKTVTLVTSHDEYTDNYLYENKGNTNGTQSAPHLLANGQDKGGKDHPYYSANCYTVKGPGWFRIPLVIGPMLREGQSNDYRDPFSYLYSIGYDPATNTEGGIYNTIKPIVKDFPHSNAMLRFMGAHVNGQEPIELHNAWLKDVYTGDDTSDADFNVANLNVELIWSDGYKLVTDVTLNGNKSYIFFQVPKDYIQQGNALLAVKHGEDILWSYHIWVTEEYDPNYPNYKEIPHTDATTGTTITFAPSPLGHCHPKTEWWTGREGDITFNQNGTNPNRITEYKFHIRQVSSQYTTHNHNMTYYQHGRKDPFPGMQVLSDETGTHYRQKHLFYENYALDKITMYNQIAVGTSGHPSGVVRYSTNGRARITKGIKNPQVLFYSDLASVTETRQQWHYRETDNTESYRNLWNNTALKDDKTNVNLQEIKTIYDPSPAHYVVPNKTNIDKIVDQNLVPFRGTGMIVDGKYVYDGDNYFWSSSYAWGVNGAGIAKSTSDNTREAQGYPVWPMKEVFIYPTIKTPTLDPPYDEGNGPYNASQFNHYYEGLEN